MNLDQDESPHPETRQISLRQAEGVRVDHIGSSLFVEGERVEVVGSPQQESLFGLLVGNPAAEKTSLRSSSITWTWTMSAGEAACQGLPAQ